MRRIPALRTGTAAALVAALFLFASVVMLWQSYLSEGAQQSRVAYAMGPAFFPRIVLYLMAAMALAVAVEAYRSGGAPVSMRRAGIALAMMLATGVYIWLIGTIGFLFASIAYSIVCPVVLGYRRWGWLLVLAFVYCAGVWYMFDRVLQIVLPGSPWFAYF